MTVKIKTVVLIDSSVDRYLCVDGIYQNPIIERISETLKDHDIKELRFDRPSWKTVLHKSCNKGYLPGLLLLFWLLKKIILKISKTNKSSEIIVGIGINSIVNYLARIACISTVEVSHGFCFAKIPWGWEKISSRYLPRKIIVFDKISMFAFEQGTDVPRPILAQHPRYESLHIDIENKQCRKSVLIALQWGYDGDDINFNGILKNGIVPCSVINIIKKKPNINFVIRLHPKMVTGEYTNFVQRVEKLFMDFSNVTIDYCKDNNLIDALINSSLVLSMYSTISFEAANVGTKSVVMCPSLLNGGINQGMFDLLYDHSVCSYIHMNDEVELEKAVERHENIDALPLFSNLPTLQNVIQKLL